MRSGLTPKASFGRSRVARRGRPGSGCLCLCTGCCPEAGAGQRGPSSLLVLLLSRSKLLTERSWVLDGAGRDCGLLAAPRAHTTVGFPALSSRPPLWGKGCRAASDWSSWEKGGGGVDACVCFQFQFFYPFLSFPPSFLFFFLCSLCLLPPVACSLRM